MSVLELIVIHVGFVIWFICGYAIGKTKYKK